MKNTFHSVWLTAYANDNDALIPEVWAQEALLFLENSLVAANLVHRDFEDEIAEFGDVVNTHRPDGFTAKRKTDADDVTVQDASVTNVPVKLDQHWHTSFKIKDGEQSKSFKDLARLHLYPAVASIAQAIDELVLMQAYRFIPSGNVVGKLGTAVSKSTLTAAKALMSRNKAPVAGRNLIVGPTMEGSFLDIDDFTNANTVGDDGTALRTGNLGQKIGFEVFMDQNAPEVAVGSTILSGLVNNGAGYPAGTVTMTVDGGVNAIAGSWMTVAGDMTPHKITAHTGTPATSITFSPGLTTAVVDNAAVTYYTPGAIDNVADYAAGYTKELVVDGFSVAPKKGQLVDFGAAVAPTLANTHGILTGATTTSILLDRATSAALVDNSLVGVGPAGNYGMAFNREAISLVTRPLALPPTGVGAMSSVVNYNGLSIRVVMTYTGTGQALLVTVDVLGGIEVLDANLGCLVLG